MVVEGPPEERFVGEAENEEVAGVRALAEDVGDLFDVGIRHAVSVVGDGGVMDERSHDGFRQRGSGGSAGRGCGSDERGGGGDYGVVSRVNESEKTRDSEEGNESQNPQTIRAALFLDIRVKKYKPCVGADIVLHLPL